MALPRTFAPSYNKHIETYRTYRKDRLNENSFTTSQKASYTSEEKLKEIVATLRMDGFQLNDENLDMLREIESGKMTYDEARAAILSEL